MVDSNEGMESRSRTSYVALMTATTAISMVYQQDFVCNRWGSSPFVRGLGKGTCREAHGYRESGASGRDEIATSG
jgi:hypothetical protein